ncbi:unnamed protein product [Cercopithifilaria johnstoni]|uniref:Uncharacterized protein n=1 Tax=Cercopithifilaria johnstoni TaxID=2874296 RepID=A0A8J2M6Z0_9BILA|nr:unnamed protein product [Cercopithifilaria johnstoni]
MRKISLSDDDNDNGYMERILPGISASTSTTPPLELPHGRSNSTSSMPSVPLTPFFSTGRHRLLPQTPENYIRRSSSPRFLPTPPSLSPRNVTTSSDCSLYKSNLEQLSVKSGRRLPQTPIHKDSTRLITAKKNASIKQSYSTTVNGDDGDNTDANDKIGNIGDNDWPSPTIVQRKFSEFQKASNSDSSAISTLFEHFSCGTPSRSLQRLSFLNQQQNRLQQQQQGRKFNQPQYSPYHSSGTSISTNALSQSSLLSPSTEQV